jgi:hypothetical protein
MPWMLEGVVVVVVVEAMVEDRYLGIRQACPRRLLVDLNDPSRRPRQLPRLNTAREKFPPLEVTTAAMLATSIQTFHNPQSEKKMCKNRC